MPNRGHAEIAGAGIAGLTAATALAQRGWDVRVHERAAHLRDIGVGTSIWENGHRALGAVGALDEVLRCGTKIARSEIFGERREVLRLQEFDERNDRALVVLRVDLHRALVNAAQRAGVEIITSSPAAAADPDGTLIMESGERFSADLVIGCDGYYSKIRDSLNLAEEVGFVTDAYIGRITIPRQNRQAFETIQEYWAGTRVCGVLSCDAVNYLFLSAPEDCPHNSEEVRTRSLYKPVWIETFPFLEDQFQRADGEVIWGRYPIVRCHAWSVGRAAILGDSAHGMPPTLAQGAGCAMANALALAELLKESTDVPAALARWERRERPVTEITQRWAVLYITVLKRWPQNLLDLRSKMVAEMFASPAMVRHFLSAARHVVESDSRL
jgi:2-polyprenyl-6-methoxyphenol hydroxylase-like FAD-dependent oxidoreductase